MRFLRSYEVLKVSFVRSGIDKVPVTYLIALVGIICGLLMINFRILYFMAICKALDVETKVS